MVKPYSVRVDSQCGTTTIVLGGEIDLAAGPEVRATIADVILAEPQTRLVIDLTATTFMDSTAVNALMLAHHAAAKVGASFEVRSNPTVDRVLEVSGVAALLGVGSKLAATG